MRWAFVFLLFSQAAFSQQIIEGKVVDAESGQPIPFASIGIIGTTRGTSSNLNGEFSLSVSDTVSLKISCIGYESVEMHDVSGNQLVQMKPIATLLNAVVVFNKAVNPKRIIKKAFANVHQNYAQQPFLQTFFYRHYCKDDSAYGRLIEAFVDVWKNDGYRDDQKFAGETEEIRVTQLRRSLDKTTFAQGHEPISVKNILQTDIIAYQAPVKSEHLSFYADVSNLKVDMEKYTFTFEGITTYDGEEVYEISYVYRQDSSLTTSGEYLQWTHASGSLFITTGTYAFVKTDDTREFTNSTIRSTAYYKKQDHYYYPYHLIRQGENKLGDNSTHAFHIDLTSLETEFDLSKKFTGKEPGKDELLNIPYDSSFWNNSAVLKTTPLEDEIIQDLGEGLTLNQQFDQYRQYEMNLRDGGKNGNEKFNWLKESSKGKRILYLFFWSSECKSYLVDLEYAKRLQKKYRNKINFVLLSIDDNEMLWQQAVSRFALYTDGIINYRIGKTSKQLESFNVRVTPAFAIISKHGDINSTVRRPSDPDLEKDIKQMIKP